MDQYITFAHCATYSGRYSVNAQQKRRLQSAFHVGISNPILSIVIGRITTFRSTMDHIYDGGTTLLYILI